MRNAEVLDGQLELDGHVGNLARVFVAVAMRQTAHTKVPIANGLHLSIHRPLAIIGGIDSDWFWHFAKHCLFQLILRQTLGQRTL